MKEKRENETMQVLLGYGQTLLGAAVYTSGVILFVNALNLFSGGAMGLSQLIRTLLEDKLGLNILGGVDISGIIYYLINIPLLVIAYRHLGKRLFLKTMIATATITILLSVVPPMKPLLGDRLTGCIVGGIITGTGNGIMLLGGGTGGGLDIVGMYLTKKYKNISVGRVSLTFNIILYLTCAIFFNVETAIYSIIVTAVSAITLDRIHYQNIMIQAMVFTKVEGISEQIMKELGRGVTEWNGDGAYTHESEHIFVSVISKYEVPRFRRVVKSIDPNAFVTYSQIYSVDGNFSKRLS